MEGRAGFSFNCYWKKIADQKSIFTILLECSHFRMQSFWFNPYINATVVFCHLERDFSFQVLRGRGVSGTLSSCEFKAWKETIKNQIWTGFKTIISAIPVQTWICFRLCVYNCNDQSCLHIVLRSSNIWYFKLWYFIYSFLYDNPTYSRILIGFFLCSIEGQRHDQYVVITEFFPLCFKMAEGFEKLDISGMKHQNITF